MVSLESQNDAAVNQAAMNTPSGSQSKCRKPDTEESPDKLSQLLDKPVDVCGYCGKKKCTTKCEALQHNWCAAWLHASCEGLTKDQYEFLNQLASSTHNICNLCNSCNMDTRDLPDMYARGPQARGLRAYMSGKSREHMLQVICITSVHYLCMGEHKTIQAQCIPCWAPFKDACVKFWLWLIMLWKRRFTESMHCSSFNRGFSIILWTCATVKN